MTANEEWAIQNEATGEWWGCSSGVGWGNVIDVYRYSYVNAVSAVTEILRGTTTARIVPAPPREMTDEECWEWFHDAAIGSYCLRPYSGAGMRWWVANYKSNPERIGAGITPCDAIRAARRKLEGK